MQKVPNTPSTNNDLGDTLRIGEVARALHVNRTTVFRWIERGYLKAVHLPSGNHRVRKEDFVEFARNLVQKKRIYRIVVIDDEPVVLNLMVEILEELDLPVEVKGFTDGLAAMLEMGSIKPDLVVIDYKLQDVDGMTLAGKITASSEFRDVPIILVSGVVADINVQQVGAKAFLPKPFEADQLQNMVKRHLRIAA